ncbi:complement C1q tumor necrosis factor-related protein 2-like [Mizuhopecten yessoensis]|uniref:Complement C1q tumor necrosis factor-related protein 2 n=1 Tax=Mizuhopecten yessoensis TaxID=6573 RepID=A0A210Q136_MIZYE|nr:complement C1q tumor necrosis factor-related protein 2-like [Mizuhopecten yessoensis]OWF42437.1 Complement C1q tumor necrosis factor-related protein 2 [Mizuhopecten yessoensis]
MGLLVLVVVLTMLQVGLAARIPRGFLDTNINSSTTEDRETIRELFALVKDTQKFLLETNKTKMAFGQQLTDLEREQAGLSAPHTTLSSAFYVTLGQDVRYPGVRRPILFDRTRLDVMGNYNTHYGKFTAYVPGVYSFSWTVATYYGHYIVAALMHGDIVAGLTMAGDTVDTSMATGTAVLRLSETNMVMVVVTESSAGAAIVASMSSFSGSFISA